MISDDAGEFVKAVEGSQLASGRILDWFHIAMKFKAAENAVRGCKVIDSLERDELEREIQGAKWLVWHGKGGKAVARIKALDDRLLARAGYEFCPLWWNLCRLGAVLNELGNSLERIALRERDDPDRVPVIADFELAAVGGVVAALV